MFTLLKSSSLFFCFPIMCKFRFLFGVLFRISGPGIKFGRGNGRKGTPNERTFKDAGLSKGRVNLERKSEKRCLDMCIHMAYVVNKESYPISKFMCDEITNNIKVP